MMPFPTPASTFVEAMNAAAEADRRDARLSPPRAPRRPGRWAALALLPALLLAALWMG